MKGSETKLVRTLFKFFTIIRSMREFECSVKWVRSVKSCVKLYDNIRFSILDGWCPRTFILKSPVMIMLSFNVLYALSKLSSNRVQ